MRKLRILVVLNLKDVNGPRLLTWVEWKKKVETLLIVSNAVENLCEILALSRVLTSVEIVYMDIGRPELRTGRESDVLEFFAHLRRIKHVKVEGATEAWTRHLTTNMKMDK